MNYREPMDIAVTLGVVCLIAAGFLVEWWTLTGTALFILALAILVAATIQESAHAK